MALSFSASVAAAPVARQQRNRPVALRQPLKVNALAVGEKVRHKPSSLPHAPLRQLEAKDVES